MVMKGPTPTIFDMFIAVAWRNPKLRCNDDDGTAVFIELVRSSTKVIQRNGNQTGMDDGAEAGT